MPARKAAGMQRASERRGHPPAEPKSVRRQPLSASAAWREIRPAHASRQSVRECRSNSARRKLKSATFKYLKRRARVAGGTQIARIVRRHASLFMQQFRTDVVQQLASTAQGRSPVAETGGKAPSGRTFPSAWGDFTVQFRDTEAALPAPWGEVFEPLRCPAPDGLMVVGQVGQSLDGRIATEAGDSHYINKTAGLEHLHRLRSLVDAVLVGVGTAIADDPQLTVRRVEGRNPARVVLDPKGRLPAAAKILNEDDVSCVILRAEGAAGASSRRAKIVTLPSSQGQIAPAAVRTALGNCGFRRVLV